MSCGGARARSKGSGSGPDGVGLRGFKSHPPHQQLLYLLLIYREVFNQDLINSTMVLRGVIVKIKRVGKCYPEIIYIACNNCLSCLKLCPYNAIYIDIDDHVKINYNKCSLCSVCFLVCPYGAIDCQWVPTPSSAQSGLIHSS